jgi:GxxExxY protein
MRSWGMTRGELIEARTTGAVISAFFEVYNYLGFGFLESVYVKALECELVAGGHEIGREVWVPVLYKGHELCRHRIDMIVDERVVVEVKSTPDLHPSSRRQIENYLRCSKLEVGLLLHFGASAKFHRLVATNSPSSIRRAT